MISHREARDSRRGSGSPLAFAVATFAMAIGVFIIGMTVAHAQRMMGSSGFGGGFRGVQGVLAPMNSTMPGSGYGPGREAVVPGMQSTRMPGRPGPRRPYPGYVRNGHPACGAANGLRDDACRGEWSTSDLDGSDRPPPRGRNAGGSSGRNRTQAAADPRYVLRQIVAELDGALTDAQIDALARRHRLTRIDSQSFALIGATLGLFRITDGRSVETVQRQMRADGRILAAQPNFRYALQEQVTKSSTEGDPAQYALAKLRLPEAHQLARGNDVIVAVVDSGIDLDHPEFAGAIAGSFDALRSKEGPHAHGTGIAGAIVSHARLMGSAPRARILAIRAFGAAPNGAESTSFVLIRALDYAASHGARVINMSFAGPQDPLMERSMVAAVTKGIALVAASGNAGPKSPPLYPAANPNVIAVGATDAYDKLFPASNRGAYIAVVAPGVGVFLPAPDGKYQLTSGTSFSAAYVSGVIALMIERDPVLKPDELRAILTGTARDLGAPGRDDLFGAGEADAFAAVSAVNGERAPAAVSAPAEPAKVSGQPSIPVTRGFDDVAASQRP